MAELVMTEEKKTSTNTVLVVDKEGSLGKELVHHITTHTTTVFVSSQKPHDATTIHIPFSNRIPEIPEGIYTHVFLLSMNADDELLTPLAQKAQQDNAKFIYILPYWLYTPELEEKLAASCSRWVLVLLGDMFGTGMDTHIDRIFDQAKHKKSIRLPELGLETIRPIAYQDVFVAVLRAGFGLEREHVCFAFSKHPYTVLSLVHALQKLDPLIRIDFAGKSEASNSVLPKGEYLLEENYAVMTKVQEAYDSHVISQTQRMLEKQKNTPISTRSSSKSYKGLFFASLFVGILFFVALPMLVTLNSGLLGSVLLHVAESTIEQGNFTVAKQYTSASTKLYGLAVQSGELWEQEAGLVGFSRMPSEMVKKEQAMYQLSQLVWFTTVAGEDFHLLASSKPFASQAIFSEGLTAVKNTLVIWDSLPMQLLPKDVQGQLRTLESLKTKIGELLDVSAPILGFDREKTYALLVTDNTELRPGGGRVMAYAITSIKQGSIGKINFYPVSEADNQLKGHVEPPFALRRYAGATHLYLADSYFSADDSKNAQTAAFFLQQELGVRVDGVMTIDTSAITALVDVVGSITLPESKETITKSNFLLKLTSLQDVSQRNKFVITVLSALEKKLLIGNSTSMRVVTLLLDNIEQKHTLFAFSDPSIQQVFSVNGMSSALWDTRKSQKNLINDFTGLSQIDFATSSSLLHKQITQQVTISSVGTISGTLTVVYPHVTQEEKGYLRILLPVGAQITNVSLNNVPQSRFPAVIDPKVYEAKHFKAQKGVEIEHTQEGGREVYGFYIAPSQPIYTIAISYGLSQKLDLSQLTSQYDAYLFKQPGTTDDLYTFALNYPSSLKLTQGPKGAQTTKNGVIVKNHLATDVDYSFSFTTQE